MTKEEVMRTIKAEGSKGSDIAQALRDYFANAIAMKQIKPLEFYKPNQENIFGEKKDITEVAQDIFAV